MNNDFEEFIRSCKMERLDKLHSQFERLESIQSLSDLSNNFYNEINDSLTIELQKILSEYTDICTNIYTQRSTYFYKNGLFDGILLGQMLYGDKKDIIFDIKVL